MELKCSCQAPFIGRPLVCRRIGQIALADVGLCRLPQKAIDEQGHHFGCGAMVRFVEE